MVMIKHRRRLCGIIMQSTGHLHGKHWRMGRLCGNYAKHWNDNDKALEKVWYNYAKHWTFAW